MNVEVDITGRKIDRQIKAVLKKDIPFMVFVGMTELKDQLYTLKDTASQNEEKLSPERLVAKIKDYRHNPGKPDEIDA